MKMILHSLLAYIIVFTITAKPEQPITMQIQASKNSKQQTQMPIAILVLSNELDPIATVIQKDLQFTDQFKPSIKKYSSQLGTPEIAREIKNLADTGTPLALCIKSSSPHHIEWRLYDTYERKMLCGKKYKKKDTSERAWAHAIADGTWKTLTGHDGFFSSRLAYCKDSKNKNGKTIRKIYLADFDGSNEELLVDGDDIIIAPRWNLKKPCLLYSQYADTKVNFMSTSLKKQAKNISQFNEGIEMLFSASPNGKDYVYCASQGNGSSQIYLYKNDKLKPCTKNSGNNISPVFLDENRICFCSDFQTGSPQIYIGNLQDGHLQRITKGGYCTSPSYCLRTNTIAYHQMIQNTMQIVLYDCATKKHTQLTDDKGNKHEVSISPDGTHLLFSHELSYDKSRLTVYNLLTNTKKYVGNAHDYYSYPHWSPCYKKFPVVA